MVTLYLFRWKVKMNVTPLWAAQPGRTAGVLQLKEGGAEHLSGRW